MKVFIALAASAVFFLGSCTVYHTAGRSGKVPPGQAKKISGRKSARDHAPGQRKKHMRHDNYYYMDININKNR